MKTLLGKLIVVALGIMTIGVPAVRAQIVTELDFKMTQAFMVGNTILPAGRYVIRPVHGTDQSVIEISATGGNPDVMV